MTQRNLTYTDPRFFDGSPYEAAQRALEQADAVAELLDTALEDAEVMARNAELERQIDLGGEPNEPDWSDGPQAKFLRQARSVLAHIRDKLPSYAAAAGFDPKHPPKE